MSYHQKLHLLLCKYKNIKLSVAESCTSGLIASRLASIGGSSSYFQGGIVAYQNKIKTEFLHVDNSLILKNTAVSKQVVIEMAKGVRDIFKSNYSIATSGYAGPTGGDINNPIGTVFIALASMEDFRVNRFIFEGNRLDIMQQASEKSIELLYKMIKKQI